MHYYYCFYWHIPASFHQPKRIISFKKLNCLHCASKCLRPKVYKWELLAICKKLDKSHPDSSCGPTQIQLQDFRHHGWRVTFVLGWLAASLVPDLSLSSTVQALLVQDSIKTLAGWQVSITFPSLRPLGRYHCGSVFHIFYVFSLAGKKSLKHFPSCRIKRKKVIEFYSWNGPLRSSHLTCSVIYSCINI